MVLGKIQAHYISLPFIVFTTSDRQTLIRSQRMKTTALPSLIEERSYSTNNPSTKLSSV